MHRTSLLRFPCKVCIHPWAVSDQRLQGLCASFLSLDHSLLHPDPSRVPRRSASSSLPRTSCWAPQLALPLGASVSPSPAMFSRLCSSCQTLLHCLNIKNVGGISVWHRWIVCIHVAHWTYPKPILCRAPVLWDPHCWGTRGPGCLCYWCCRRPLAASLTWSVTRLTRGAPSPSTSACPSTLRLPTLTRCLSSMKSLSLHNVLIVQ